MWTVCSTTTGRHTDLGLRLATALFGHAGVEWDLTGVPDAELSRIRAWTALHKELRGLLHSGTTVRSDDAGEGALLHGVVGDSDAVYAYVRLATGADAVPPRLRLPGLDPTRRYQVRVRTEVAEPLSVGKAQPPWPATGVELPGTVLTTAGLAAPLLHPGQALILHAAAG